MKRDKYGPNPFTWLYRRCFYLSSFSSEIWLRFRGRKLEKYSKISTKYL